MRNRKYRTSGSDLIKYIGLRGISQILVPVQWSQIADNPDPWWGSGAQFKEAYDQLFPGTWSYIAAYGAANCQSILRTIEAAKSLDPQVRCCFWTRCSPLASLSFEFSLNRRDVNLNSGDQDATSSEQLGFVEKGASMVVTSFPNSEGDFLFPTRFCAPRCWEMRRIFRNRSTAGLISPNTCR